ncbi:MAG: hypothetical protein N2112_11045 [Gemmataceae bacterium]|jgi:hypothetical protein|nr:hypothetical protein [Gemmataceae bacterium]
MRLLCFLSLLFLVSFTSAADNLAGTWRLPVPVQTREGPLTLNFLLLFTETEGKWVVDVLDISPPVGAEATGEVKVKDDNFKLTLKIGPNTINMDGKLTPNAKKAKGNVEIGKSSNLIEMNRSSLKNLTKDPFGLLREELEIAEGTPNYFNALYPVLGKASEKKLKAEEVRTFVDKANKLAEDYGARWQRTVALRTAETLITQEDYIPIAVEQARLAERLIDRSDDLSVQISSLESVANLLRKGKKLDDVKQIESQLAKLEPRDYADYLKNHPPFKVEEYKGRKAKSDRVILVELFTGADCAPCVAADLACDAIAKAFKPTEVIVLQYHAHIPGPDPLTVREADDRHAYYQKKEDERFTPFLAVNGKPEAGFGGQIRAAKVKYQSLRENLEEQLEKPATGKLALSASLKEGTISIKANVSGLSKTGEKVSLRFAIVEDRIRYTGANGLRYHHSVVRAMPEGVKGVPCTKKEFDHATTVKVSDIQTAITKYLDDFTNLVRKEGDENFSFSARPGTLKNLRVIAFIQDDETQEVIQSAAVDLEEK